MTVKQILILVMKGHVKLSDVFHFIVGNYRYVTYIRAYEKRKEAIDNGIAYYTMKKPLLIRRHIWEQINMRIIAMDKECYNNGACKICDCETPALQMANRPCDKPCYPPMMNKSDWKEFKSGSYFYDEDSRTTWYINEQGFLKSCCTKEEKQNQHV